MNSSSSETLAHEIAQGTYTTATLADCNGLLTLDRNPQIVLFSQLLLVSPEIARPGPAPSVYMALQPALLFRNDAVEYEKNLKKTIKSFATTALEAAPSRRFPPAKIERIQE